MNDYYITPQEYERAERNGVDSNNLTRRVRLLGWDKERAINKKKRDLKPRGTWTEYIKKAEMNGICKNTFMTRVIKYNMPAHEAATKPLQNKKENCIYMAAKRKIYPRKWIRKAEENNISYHTFRSRVLKGMSYEEAATKKIMSKSEAGKKGALKLREKKYIN